MKTSFTILVELQNLTVVINILFLSRFLQEIITLIRYPLTGFDQDSWHVSWKLNRRRGTARSAW